MNRIKYYWNGKIPGIPGVTFLILKVVLLKIRDRLTGMIIKNNLGKTGKNIRINGGVKYRYPANISIGNNVSIGRNVELVSENNAGKIQIMNDVIIAVGVRIDFSGGVRIGSNSLISKNAVIETHDHGIDPHSDPSFKNLHIGTNVWIGMNSIILPDVKKIGNNSVIAAGAVVTSEVPPNVIIGGVPAKIIKNLV